MIEPLVIKVRELRAVMAFLLNAVEQRFGPSLELGADDYWMLDYDDAYDMNTHPAEAIGVGHPTDDVEEMRTVLSEREVMSLWHDLGHVVGVLSRIAALDSP